MESKRDLRRRMRRLTDDLDAARAELGYIDHERQLLRRAYLDADKERRRQITSFLGQTLGPALERRNRAALIVVSSIQQPDHRSLGGTGMTDVGEPGDRANQHELRESLHKLWTELASNHRLLIEAQQTRVPPGAELLIVFAMGMIRRAMHGNPIYSDEMAIVTRATHDARDWWLENYSKDPHLEARDHFLRTLQLIETHP
ncbi:MAG: hypothetical protein FWC87_04210 [Acidimicrobiaceae bacterium]|nr:hypothetical protein [Acidimicrobiaceae bacterium]